MLPGTARAVGSCKLPISKPEGFAPAGVPHRPFSALGAPLTLPADMPRATFFRCRTCREEEGGGILLYTPMKWKREGWIVKWRQVRRGGWFGLSLDVRP